MKLSGDRNRCPSCHSHFNSTAAFDKHRVGYFDTPTKRWTFKRRCMTQAEMLDAGMAQNDRGFWVGTPNPMFAEAA